MFTSQELAERIRSVAKSKGSTVKDILVSSGLTTNAIVNMTKGSMPKADNLAKIAIALDCSMDYLMGLTDDPAPVGTNKPLAIEQGDRIVRALLDGTGLIGEDGTITPDGLDIIAGFIRSNADMLRRLLSEK